VFDGLEDYLARIDDPALEIDEHTLLFMRGAGPIGYPGSCEIVNMRPPTYLLKRENWPLPWTLPCIGDGRQSGTSAGPSILNASPEAAVGGGIALLKTGDRVRIDLGKRTANILISDEELEKRRQALEESGGYKYPESQTPWQEIFREHVDQLSNGMVLKNAVKYQRIAETKGLPREDF
jgi:dihydroxy-acid dehydratase